jgi:hypothetical protein
MCTLVVVVLLLRLDVLCLVDSLGRSRVVGPTRIYDSSFHELEGYLDYDE